MILSWTATLTSTAAFSQVVRGALYDQVINTSYGLVKGYPAFDSEPAGNLSNWKAITVWSGIPFAAATGGKNRWRAPQPAAAWNGSLDAKSYGNICPSSTQASYGYTVDEDCLNLNIWSPGSSVSTKLPVVIWSYPAFSTAAFFDGGGLADKGGVSVTYNYRTGSFGWLAHPELSAQFFVATGPNSSGNWGILVQFEAVKWVHANIAAFGGDRDHITVMGQSAGSAATQHILNSKLMSGLNAGAIIQSGVRDPHDPLCSSLAVNYLTLDVTLDQGVKYVASKNVSSITELRDLSMDSLTETFKTSSSESEWSFTATPDYYAMPDRYYNTLVKGLAQYVPVITGNARDESGAAEGFFNQYPAHDSVTSRAAYNTHWTDRSKIGTWNWATLWASAKKSPVYTYVWEHAPPGQTDGAYHMSEISYVVNSLYVESLMSTKPWQNKDYEIASKMSTYWANFVKTGNPNGEVLANWKPTGVKPIIQRLGDGFESIIIASQDRISVAQSWFSTLVPF